MATYYALTTTNAQMNGWTILAIRSSKAEAEAEGLAQIGDGNDIYAQTERKNFVVVSQTTARSRFGITNYTLEEYDATQATRHGQDR